MIKRHFSKYTGEQIDKALKVLIENNIKEEDFSSAFIEIVKGWDQNAIDEALKDYTTLEKFADAVLKTGDQTIGGEKTFTSNIVLGDGVEITPQLNKKASLGNEAKYFDKAYIDESNVNKVNAGEIIVGKTKIDGLSISIDDKPIALQEEVPTKVSQLKNDNLYISDFEENPSIITGGAWRFETLNEQVPEDITADTYNHTVTDSDGNTFVKIRVGVGRKLSSNEKYLIFTATNSSGDDIVIFNPNNMDGTSFINNKLRDDYYLIFNESLQEDELEFLNSLKIYAKKTPNAKLVDYIKKLIPTKTSQLENDSILNAIVDVELANFGGTAVPNSGYVENVYFNTSLSIKQVVDLLNKYSEGNSYYFLGDSSMSTAIGADHHQEDGSDFWYILAVINGEPLYLFSNNVDSEFVGWNPNITFPLEVNAECVDQIIDGEDVFNIGFNNDKLSELFSITPYASKNEQVFYRTGGVATGSTVPNTGYVEKIYFNIKLSTYDVVTAIQNANLDFTYNETLSLLAGMNIYVYRLFSHKDHQKQGAELSILKLDDGYALLDDSIGVFFTSKPYSSLNANFQGWSVNFTGVFNVDDESISHKDEVAIGESNYKLVSLLSTTPYNETTPVLYHIKNGVNYELATNNDLKLKADQTYVDESLLKKVNKVDGKGLSTNDLTNELLQSLQDKYTKQEVLDLIGSINTLDLKVVKELPTEDISTTSIYLKETNNTDEENIYEEWIYVNDAWELVGTTKVDLSDYAKRSELPTKVSELENDAGYIKEQIINPDIIQGKWKINRTKYSHPSAGTVIYQLRYNGNFTDSDGNEYEAIEFTYGTIGSSGENLIRGFKVGEATASKIFQVVAGNTLSGLAVNEDLQTLRSDYYLVFKDGDWAPADKTRSALELISFCAKKVGELDDSDGQLNIDSLVTKDDLEDYATKDDLDDINLTYTNLTKTEIALGGIKVGQTFENVSIQDMLTRILYPYIDLQIDSVTSNPTATSYDVVNLPILKSVSINVIKNHATNLDFRLMSGSTQYGKTLTEADIVNDRLTFSNLGTYIDANGQEQDGLKIEVSTSFTIVYSYKGETSTVEGEKTVGTFSIIFRDPSKPTISSNLSTSGGNISRYVGETAKLTKIEAKITPNSAAATGITKLELLKDGTSIEEKENPTSYVFNHTANITESTTYKVKMTYNSRTGDSTELTPATLISNEFKITFTFVDPTVSMNNTSTVSKSILDATSIAANSLSASFTKNSGKVTQVKLLRDNVEVESKNVSGYNDDVYNDTSKSVTFNYSSDKIYSDTSFKAAIYNDNGLVKTSSNSKSYTVYYPHCYGWVDSGTTLDSINLSVLKTIAGQKSLSSSTSNVVLSEPDGQRKLLYMTHGTSYTKIKDNNTGFDVTDGYHIGTKTITFDDNSTKTYNVYLLKIAAQAAANLQFS